MELKSKFAVGRYTCEMSYKPDEGRLDAEWLPDVPSAKSFSKKLMAQYRPRPSCLPNGWFAHFATSLE